MRNCAAAVAVHTSIRQTRVTDGVRHVMTTAVATDAGGGLRIGGFVGFAHAHARHEHLDRTGLIHRGGRVYDPTLGRFLSPDPLVGDRARRRRGTATATSRTAR